MYCLFRYQYPLIPGYAYTVHRAQGMTMDFLGLYFAGAPWCHGILYTALSRVRGDWGSIAVWVHEDDDGALPPV